MVHRLRSDALYAGPVDVQDSDDELLPCRCAVTHLGAKTYSIAERSLFAFAGHSLPPQCPHFFDRGPVMKVGINAKANSSQPGTRGDFGRSSVLACAIAGALLLAAAQIALANKKSSLPDAVFFAKTIYVDNQANDAGLQHSAYMALAHWGHFQVVEVPNGAAVAPEGFTRLTLVDAKSGAVLWSDLSRTNKPEIALRMLDGLRDAVTQGLKDRGKY